MSPPVVLVTFSCESGETEKLALSAAVGAVQARALIRLRRIPDSGSSASNEEVVRMRKEYVGPAEADVAGADAVIIATGSTAEESSQSWQTFLSLLRKLGTEGKLKRKVAASIGGLSASLAGLGFEKVANVEGDPLVLGRAVAEMARTLKSA
ncbi:MAG TPA: hypothetical protein VFR05_11215 [Terriglobia bacterium]|nr:hypothetical protein [Terriglobia bacterium]